MPINKSALKRERQNVVRRERNRALKSKVHTAYLRLTEVMDAKKEEEIEERLRFYVSEIDKAVKKGVFHGNKGARKKSRITKKIKELLKENPKVKKETV